MYANYVEYAPWIDPYDLAAINSFHPSKVPSARKEFKVGPVPPEAMDPPVHSDLLATMGIPGLQADLVWKDKTEPQVSRQPNVRMLREEEFT